MACSLIVFGLDDPSSLGCQDCLINNAALSGLKTHCYYKLIAAVGTECVVLRARLSTAVEEGVLVVPVWVLDLLDILPGRAVAVEFIDCVGSCDESVSLTFITALNNSHWDEPHQEHAFGEVAVWSKAWPSVLSVDDCLDTVRSVWPSRPFFSPGSVLAVEVLSFTMVFSVSTGTGESELTRECKISICEDPSAVFVVPRGEENDRIGLIDAKALNRIDEDLHLHCDGVLSSQREAYATAATLLTAMLVPSGVRWDGAHSLLLVGPSGAGCTWLLQSLIAAVTNLTRRCCNIVIARTSSRESYGSVGLSRLQLKPIADRLSGGGDKVVVSLNKLLQSVDVSDVYCSDNALLNHILNANNTESAQNIPIRLTLFIDKLEDQVLDADDKDQESIAGVMLRDLLEAISTRDTATAHVVLFDVLVIGSCVQVGMGPLKRLCRPLAFELMRHLYNPSEQDRLNLITVQQQKEGCVFCGDAQVDIADSFSTLSLANEVTDPGKYVQKLAKLTAGYLPKDIKLILQRARLYQQGLIAAANDKVVGHCFVEWPVVLKSLAATPPSRLSTVLSYSFVENVSTDIVSADGVKRPLVWADFGGHAEIKSRLQTLINKLKYSSSGSGESVVTLDNVMDKPRGIVITGRPGTGKSYLVRVLASEAKMNFLSVNSTLLLSKYFGETEENIRKLFVGARAVSPCVLFFDEFEVISKKRIMGEDSSSGGMDGGVGSRILSTFLNELDGISGNAGVNGGGDVLVIVACSDVNNLDAAIVRPGRLQHHFVLKELKDADMNDIIDIQIQSFPERRCEDISATEVVSIIRERSNQYSSQLSRDTHLPPVAIVTICSNALLLAVKETISAGDSQIQCLVCRRHIIAAIDEYYGIS